MKNYTITPYIRVAWDNFCMQNDWYIPPRVIFDYEIICLMQGEIELMVDEEYYKVFPGDFIIIRPMQRHSIRSIGKDFVRQPHVHFDLQEDEYSEMVYISFKDLKDINPTEYKFFRKDILADICPNMPSVLRTARSKKISELLLGIIEEKDKRMVYSDIQANGLFLQMLSMLLREADQVGEHEKNAENDVAWKAQQYLTSNLNRNISLDELSEQIHVSKYYLSHKFKEIFGVSPKQYHMDSRIDYAKKMLTNTQDSIGNIAEKTGFENIYSFSRAFKKREHVSPSIYRKE